MGGLNGDDTDDATYFLIVGMKNKHFEIGEWRGTGLYHVKGFQRVVAWLSVLFVFFSGNSGDIQQRFPGSSSPATKTSTTSTTVDGAPIFAKVQLCSCSHNVKGSTGSTHPFSGFSVEKASFLGAKLSLQISSLLSTRTTLPFVTSIRMSLKLPWPIFVGLKHDSFDGPVPYLYQNMMVKFGKYLHKYTLF